MRFDFIPSMILLHILAALSLLQGPPSVGARDSALTVVDDLHRSITMHGPARRIVSLAPSITETLFAVGAGDQVVGVTTFCTFPPEAKSKRRVGGITNPSIETIVSLRPDLILVSMEGNVRDDFTALVSLGIPVFVTNPRTLDGIHKSVTDIGRLTGNTAHASALVQSMKSIEDSIITLASSQPRVRLYLFVSLQPIIVVGKGTYLNELIGLAGGVNLAADAPSTYPMLSREVIIENQPDDLLFTSDILAGPDDLVALYPEWNNLKAIRTGRVFGVDADIVSRPGPRVVEAMKLLYHLLHAGSQ